MDTAALVVAYAGLPPAPKQTAVTGQLIGFELAGSPAKPPAHSASECRLWLREQGYRPDFAAWETLRRPCRRVEVWLREQADVEQVEMQQWDIRRWAGDQQPAPLQLAPEQRMTAEDYARMAARLERGQQFYFARRWRD